MEKIVITGTGTVNAVGHDVEQTWENITAGMPGVGPITLFDTEEFIVKIACEVKDFDLSQYLDVRQSRRRDRYQQFAAVAVQQALAESGLEITEENAPRIGVVLATGVGGLTSTEANITVMNEGGPRKVSPFTIPMLMPNGAAGLVGIDHGPKGPAFSVASACASGQDGMGVAWMMLRSGMADVMVTGASETPITRLSIAAFDRMRATSRRGVDEGTPSPFDLNRDGLVAGEGAGIIILETESHAKARGANILAEFASYAATADAYHITAPSEDGVGGSAAMRQALETAKVNPDEVGYISAHGTGTPLNDASETNAIKGVFGDHAYKVPISSTKSMTGHMMGATGAVEAVLCIKAIQNNVVPPTINYQTPDPACDLDYIPNEARDHEVKVTVSNAFGFGGHNGVVVLREYEG